MHCDLLLPGLAFPLRGSETAPPCPRLPALEFLLGRARRQRRPALATEEWLCRAFGLDDCPAGTLSAHADGLAGDGWLRADPVHLDARLDRVRLLDARVFALDADAAATLVDALNRHFAADGLHFAAPRPERWYLRLPGSPATATRPLSAVAGDDINDRLPKGDAGRGLRRIMNEAQMLLFDHPLNTARNERGLPPINGLWLWGEGVAAAPRTEYHRVLTRDALARGLALAADCRLAPPDDVAGLLAEPAERLLLHLDALDAPAAYGDIAAWTAALRELETRWFTPLRAALGGKLHGLTIHVPGPGDGLRFDLDGGSRWRFWRAGRSPAALALNIDR